MNEITGRLDDLRTEISALEETLRSLRAECGARALASAALGDDEPFAELRKEHAEVDARAAAIADTRERIDVISARFDELDSERQSLERERREITSDVDPLYEKVGEAAFEVYRGNPLIDEECAEIFATALERTQTIRDLETELEQQQEEPDQTSFFDRVRARGRRAILKSRIASIRSGMRSVYRSAGRRIVETDFISTMGDPKLSAAVEPFRETTAKVHRVNEKLAALESERESLSVEMNSFSALGRVRRRLRELSDEERLLLDTRIGIQARVCEEIEKLGDKEKPAPLSTDDLGPFDAVTKTRAKLAELENLQERLRAALDAELIAERIATLEKDVARRGEQIKQLEAEIHALNEEHEELKKKLTAVRKKRGPLSGLK